MSIVLDEVEWAEAMLSDARLGKHPFETLQRLAKYYRKYEGCRRHEVREKLEEYLKMCDPDISPFHWADVIDKAAKAGERGELIRLKSIDITESELATISVLDGTQRQRLAFTLLCVAKYYNAARPKNNGWVNESMKEIVKLAGLSLTEKKRRWLIRELYLGGFIGLSRKVDNLNMRVLFINNDSPVAIRIDDFRNLGNQYLMHYGGPYIKCESCGLTVRKRCNAQKFCAECTPSVRDKAQKQANT